MNDQPNPPSETCEPTWTFRGYHLEPSHFVTAMAHFYRGEVQRSNTWRSRLDATTNWAVITVAAALTFSFSAAANPHFVLLLVFMLVLTFLYIEARRYRYYVLWYYRVHLMETDFFAAMLAPPFRPSSDWADRLADSLLHPHFPITRWEAVGRRFRRNYVWLISLLLISWAAKLALHPHPAADLVTVMSRAAIGGLPGPWVVAAVGAIYVSLCAMALLASVAPTQRERLPHLLRWLYGVGRRAGGPATPMPRPQERLAIVITEHGREVARRLLDELRRGVTELQGTGMYTGQPRDVLLCAVTNVQVAHMEEIVYRTDPGAFVVVSPVEEVRGRGFRPFEAPS